MIRALLVLVALTGCRIDGLDLTGKQCPCPEDQGWTCDTPRNVCVRSGAIDDARADSFDPIDSSIDSRIDPASCLPTPFLTPLYSTATFADFGAQWTSGGGNWGPSVIEVVQSNALSTLSFIEHRVNTANYRVVTTMHATSGGSGRAIEIALRIDSQQTHMYHCNWEPDDPNGQSAFLIQHTDSPANIGGVVIETTIDTTAVAGYTKTTPVVMEFQATGNQLECCIRGFPNAYLKGNDNLYGTGSVGLKTYEMSGGFHDFAVFVP